MNTIIRHLILQLVLILLNAVFACAEIAVISMNEAKISQLAQSGDKRAKRLSLLSGQPSDFLATIQIAITLSGFLGSAFAADNFSEYIVNWLISIGVSISPATLDTVSVIAITLLLSYITLVFGELVPKRLAMNKPDSAALYTATLVYIISKIFSPLVKLLTLSTNLVLRIFGVDPNEELSEVSEENIRVMAQAGSEKGIIDTDENEIIQNLFEFDDITVGEFATHRTDIDLLWTDESVDQWETTIYETRHSLYPVCDGSVDNIIGILDVKVFFRVRGGGMEEILSTTVTPAYFIPETIRADVLFRQMKSSHNHFAVVLDEYGGTAGIVTINDLLEQLVGDLFDGDEAEEIEQLDENRWRISGSAPLDEVAEALSITLPVDEYETFGGLVFSAYGSVPEDGISFDIDIGEMQVSVKQIKEHRIESAVVFVNPDRGNSEDGA